MFRKKIIIIPHIDSDGLASASLIALYSLKKYNSFPKFIFPKDTEINDSCIETLKKEKPDIIYVLDLVPPKIIKNFAKEYTLVIDHHKKVEGFNYIFNRDYCTSYLTYNYVKKELEDNKFLKFIALVGCFCDKDEKCIEELRKNFSEVEIKIAKKLNYLINSLRALNGKFCDIGISLLIEIHNLKSLDIVNSRNEKVKTLKKISQKVGKIINYCTRSIELLVKDSIIIGKISSPYNVQGFIASNYAKINKDKVVFILNKNEDFIYVEGRYFGEKDYISVIEIIKEFCEKYGIERYGGHKEAAGCKISKSLEKEFIDFLTNLSLDI